MTKKYKILLSITGLLTILLITIGLSYAYFSANLTGEEEEATITVTGGTMNIVYDGGNGIVALNISPKDVPIAAKTFTVTGNNTTMIPMGYKINLIIESNTFSEEALKYKLISINTDNNGAVAPSISNLIKIGTGAKTTELGTGVFTSSTLGNKVHTYNLEIYFPNEDYNQNIDQGKEFKAHIEIKEYVPIMLNEYVISLASNASETGVYNEYGYRYEGANPNNYLIFNNELWRIIGVFDEVTHGIKENLVKIIRAESLNNQAWDAKENIGVNDWSNADLKNYFNEEYYINIDQSNKNLIQEVTWKLGGYSTIESTPETFYTVERGESVYPGKPISWSGKIGLMYPSDYGYAASTSECARTINLSFYNIENCKNNNWLYKGGHHEWTLTPYSGNGYDVFHVHDTARLNIYLANDTLMVRPTIYLKSSTVKLGGEGTSTNPYKILAG